MARKANPQTPNIVRSGINNGYRYAYVQKLVPVGKEPDIQQKRRKIQLGRLLEGNVFEPNNTFRLMVFICFLVLYPWRSGSRSGSPS